MGKIVKLQTKKDILTQPVHVKDLNIMEQIMLDPYGIIEDDKFMLNNVVDNGYNSSILCEALELTTLEVEIQNEIYKMFYCEPDPFYTHSDVMFNTKRFIDGFVNKKNHLNNKVKDKFKPNDEPLPNIKTGYPYFTPV